MQLPLDAREELAIALDDALSVAQFKVVARYGIGLNAENLPQGLGKEGLIEELIDAAERADRMGDFVTAALERAGTNILLGNWWKKWGPFPLRTQGGGPSNALGLQSSAPASLVGITTPQAQGGTFAHPAAGPAPASEGQRAKSAGGLIPLGPAAPSGGPADMRSIWERVLDDVWGQVWDVVRGVLGDSARDEVRTRLAFEMRQRIDTGYSIDPRGPSQNPAPADLRPDIKDQGAANKRRNDT